jgi:hypothetical protein
MFRRALVLCTCLFCIAEISQVSAEDRITVIPNTASGPGFTVTVLRVVRTELPGNKPALSIKYSYEFSKLSSVRIRGLGVVPSKGSFSYVTTENTVMFSEPGRQGPLVEVPLQETLALAARPPLTEIPQEFPQQFKIYDWNATKSLQQSANTTLNQYFHVRVFEEGDVNFIETTYAEINSPELPKGMIGQLALQFSFPFNPTTQTFSLHVQSVVREGRELSEDFKPAFTPVVLKEADKFIEKIVNEIKNGKS